MQSAVKLVGHFYQSFRLSLVVPCPLPQQYEGMRLQEDGHFPHLFRGHPCLSQKEFILIGSAAGHLSYVFRPAVNQEQGKSSWWGVLVMEGDAEIGTFGS